jgi:hypothetical protein
MERWLSGRKRHPAKVLLWLSGVEGSNPSLSAIKAVFCLQRPLNPVCLHLQLLNMKGLLGTLCHELHERWECLKLDIRSIPGHGMTDEENARFHLKKICTECRAWRAEMRDVLGNNTCWWKANWEAGNYDIPRHFGPWNCVVGQYIFGCTWLDRFRKIDAEMKGGSE